MKQFSSSIGLTLLLATLAGADYQPLSFVDLAGASDAIAVGTVTALHRETYALKIDEAIIGTPQAGDAIQVGRFGDWPCASRWAPYEVGQKLLVFLDRNADGKTWHGRGAACEGESPIVDDAVHANFAAPGKPIEYETISLGKATLYALPLASVRAAIVDVRASYRLTRAKDPLRKINARDAYVSYLPFDQIEELHSSKPRFPERRPPQPFAERSAVHRFLADAIAAEQKNLALERGDNE